MNPDLGLNSSEPSEPRELDSQLSDLLSLIRGDPSVDAYRERFAAVLDKMARGDDRLDERALHRERFAAVLDNPGEGEAHPEQVRRWAKGSKSLKQRQLYVKQRYLYVKQRQLFDIKGKSNEYRRVQTLAGDQDEGRTQTRLANRAELIRLQLQRFRDDERWHRYRSEAGPRERSLLAELNVDVRDLSDLRDPTFEYHRGFVEFMRLEARDFLNNAKRIFAATPLLHLELIPHEAVHLSKILEIRELTRLETLALRGWHLNDAAADLLASSDATKNLLGLDLSANHLTKRGVSALGLGARPRLLMLDLTDNPYDPRDVPDYDEDGCSRYSKTKEGIELERLANCELFWLHPEQTRMADRYHLRLLEHDLGRVLSDEHKSAPASGVTAPSFATGSGS